uniref:monocarboxylate transporter 12-like isoform X3 n=1 Tax=Myxine glutinosa TaxID=7769 RepID=UPI00358E9D42
MRRGSSPLLRKPPDGGWGWMVVAACFVLMVCTRAVTRCLSIFFVDFQEHFAQSHANTAWINSITDCNTMLFCVGFALCYSPALVMIDRYFGRRRALAMGIGLSGSGVGTFMLAPIIQFMIVKFSWRGALLILGAFTSNLCICGALMRPIHFKNFAPPEDNEEKLEKTAGNESSLWRRAFILVSQSVSCWLGETHTLVRCPLFAAYLLSLLLLASGCGIPFVYLVPYAQSHGISFQHASLLLSLTGIMSIVGNVTYGWLVDCSFFRRRRWWCYVFAITLEGICSLCLPFAQYVPPLALLAGLYGYFDGAYVTLLAIIATDLVPAHLTPTAIGLTYGIHGLPYLLGPPLSGWMVDQTDSYTTSFLFSGSAILASAMLFAVATLVVSNPGPGGEAKASGQEGELISSGLSGNGAFPRPIGEATVPGMNCEGGRL